jgi:hypothetical protein
MSWQAQLKQRCDQLSIQPIIMDNELVLICPKIPETPVKNELESIIPTGTNYRFQEGPRIETEEGLKLILKTAGAISAQVEMKGHNFTINVDSQSQYLTNQDSDIWPPINGLLNADPFIESWKILVNGTIMAEHNKIIAKIISSQIRPERDRFLSHDDILNLQITLENCQDVNDFINAL